MASALLEQRGMPMSDETPTLVPSVTIDLHEQADRLHELACELDEYYWEVLATARGDDDLGYQVRLWIGQLAARRLLLDEVARHKRATEVAVPVASLDEAGVLLDATDALDDAIGRDDAFDAVYLTVARVLAAADRVALAAARGRAAAATQG
jgi:hypothetical protein